MNDTQTTHKSRGSKAPIPKAPIVKPKRSVSKDKKTSKRTAHSAQRKQNHNEDLGRQTHDPSRGFPVDYNLLTQTPLPSDPQIEQMKADFGLEMSNTFEQIEEQVKQEEASRMYSQEEGRDDTVVDLLTMTNQKPHHLREGPAEVIKTTKGKSNDNKNYLFDCDMSAIPEGRAVQNRTGLSEDSRYSNLLSHKSETNRFSKKKEVAHEKAKAKKETRNSQGFKNKLEKTLQDAKRIDEDPSCFEDSPDNPTEMTQQTVQGFYQPAYPVYLYPQPVMMVPQVHQPTPSPGLASLTYQKEKILAELAQLGQLEKEALQKAQNLGAGSYKHTADWLQREAIPGQPIAQPLEESIVPRQGQGFHQAEAELLQSLDKIDQLLAKKRLDNHQEQRPPVHPSHTLRKIDLGMREVPEETLNDSLSAADPDQTTPHQTDLENSQVKLEDSLYKETSEWTSDGGLDFERAQLNHKESQKQTYLGIKNKACEQKQEEKTPIPKERQREEANKVIHNEHGVLKVANKAYLNRLLED